MLINFTKRHNYPQPLFVQLAQKTPAGSFLQNKSYKINVVDEERKFDNLKDALVAMRELNESRSDKLIYHSFFYIVIDDTHKKVAWPAAPE